MKRKLGPVHPIRYVIEHLFWRSANRWRETWWFGRAWYHVWEWIFRKWDAQVVPRLTPYRWFRERYDFLTTMRIPPRLNGFVYGSPEEGYAAEIIEAGGPWRIAVFCGDTVEEAEKDAMDFLGHFAKEAGTWSRDGVWSVMWHERRPTYEDETYTR